MDGSPTRRPLVWAEQGSLSVRTEDGTAVVPLDRVRRIDVDTDHPRIRSGMGERAALWFLTFGFLGWIGLSVLTATFVPQPARDGWIIAEVVVLMVLGPLFLFGATRVSLHAGIERRFIGPREANISVVVQGGRVMASVRTDGMTALADRRAAMEHVVRHRQGHASSEEPA